MAEVQARVEAALRQTLARYAGKTIVVVSHVNPIKLCVRYCLDAPLAMVNKMLLAPASLTTMSFYESGASALAPVLRHPLTELSAPHAAARAPF